MKFKPPGRRGLIRGLAVSGVAIASATTLVMTQAPAFADPSVTYIAVGSDTTQKVIDAFTVDLSGNLLASYDAVNPTSTTTNQIAGEVVSMQKTGTGITGPASGSDVTANYSGPRYCSFTRPNGSGAGVSAMRQSMGSTATISTAPGETVTVTGPNNANPPVNDTVTGPIPNNAPQSGCVDVGRSSSAPGGSSVDPTSGNLIYIPFALDTVAASVGSNGQLASLVGAGGLSLPQLKAMYTSGTGQVVGTTCYEPKNGTACTGTFSTTITVDLYVPQPGSGTRNFWLTTLIGSVPNPLPNWVFDHIQAGPNTGTAVEEHDGTAVSTDPTGIAPFSVSQWISQQKSGFGHVNFVGQAVLLPMAVTTGGTAVSPTNGTFPNESLNPAFPVLREVYNVVQYDRVVNTSDGQFDANLSGLFVGANSQLCQDAAELIAYGFGLLTAAPLGHHCGDIDTTHLRAFGPTTGF